MKTEEEGGKTRCCGPQGCGAWVYDADAPHLPDGGYVRYCIASDCMAWRWKIGPPTPEVTAPYNETSEQHKWRGYCGLAGKI